MENDVPIIMLVEDNESDAELFRWVLQQTLPQASFLWFRDGDEVLNYFYQKEDFPSLAETPLPSFIFLDRKLLRIHASELLKRIKQDERIKPVPVFLWISKQSEEAGQIEEEQGISGYLLKPNNIAQFKQDMQDFFAQHLDHKKYKGILH
ncbi:response regulator [Dictyobacter formicarum]|uniref:Response regulator n=1 Tax=Dictyobacter formicarum TaxID=2778368 RepID=A0ABQ3VTG0_9CHLR|nr:response regulator [Dictyobacter formicarum]GHO89515.1 response regulator [Dictyobacter formicarum]